MPPAFGHDEKVAFYLEQGLPIEYAVQRAAADKAQAYLTTVFASNPQSAETETAYIESLLN